MIHIELDVDEGVLASLRQDPATFTRELRLAAAVKWYEMRHISQGRAAELAGVSRAAFIDALGRYKVSPFQQTADEVLQDFCSCSVERTSNPCEVLFGGSTR
jgi:predicted HTH domain antitoxin